MSEPCIDGTQAHFWKIEPYQKKPRLEAVCLKCGATKDFPNSEAGVYVEDGYCFGGTVLRRESALRGQTRGRKARGVQR